MAVVTNAAAHNELRHEIAHNILSFTIRNTTRTMSGTAATRRL